jgi:hypothetical protein
LKEENATRALLKEKAKDKKRRREEERRKKRSKEKNETGKRGAGERRD